jgi:hypothetical protein
MAFVPADEAADYAPRRAGLLVVFLRQTLKDREIQTQVAAGIYSGLPIALLPL